MEVMTLPLTIHEYSISLKFQISIRMCTSLPKLDSISASRMLHSLGHAAPSPGLLLLRLGRPQEEPAGLCDGQLEHQELYPTR